MKLNSKLEQGTWLSVPQSQAKSLAEHVKIILGKMAEEAYILRSRELLPNPEGRPGLDGPVAWLDYIDYYYLYSAISSFTKKGNQL